MKKEKGSITLYVLIACIFFVIILSIVYTNVVHKKQAQEESIAQIQNNYASNISDTNNNDNNCNCNTGEIMQRLEKVEKEVATLTTENTQKTNEINELKTRMTSAENSIKILSKEYDIIDDTITCDELLKQATVGKRIYYEHGSVYPCFGSGIILNYSYVWRRVNLILSSNDSSKTYLWSVDCTNGDLLMKDCITVTALN